MWRSENRKGEHVIIWSKLTTEFEKLAWEYCEVKVRVVDLRRLVAKLPCEVEGDPDCRPCWMEYDEGAITLEECCESCQTTRPLVDERRRLAVALPNLAKKMYAEFRKGVTP